jgi:hypothetical protein
MKTDHGVPPLASAAPVNDSSTPLPKPAPTPLRYSTSVSLSSKRSSRIVHRQTSQQLDPRHLDSLREVSENLNDSTPTGAMRRLIGVESKSIGTSIAVKSNERIKAMEILLEEMEQSLSRKETSIRSMSQAVSLDFGPADNRRKPNVSNSASSLGLDSKLHLFRHQRIVILALPLHLSPVSHTGYELCRRQTYLKVKSLCQNNFEYLLHIYPQ